MDYLSKNPLDLIIGYLFNRDMKSISIQILDGDKIVETLKLEPILHLRILATAYAMKLSPAQAMRQLIREIITCDDYDGPTIWGPSEKHYEAAAAR